MNDRLKTLSEWNAELKSSLESNQLNEIERIFTEYNFKKAVCSAIRIHFLNWDNNDLQALNHFFHELIRIDFCKIISLWPNPTSLFNAMLKFGSYIESFLDPFVESKRNELGEEDYKKINMFVISFQTSIDSLLLYLSKQKFSFYANDAMICCFETSYWNKKNSKIIENAMAILDLGCPNTH